MRLPFPLLTVLLFSAVLAVGIFSFTGRLYLQRGAEPPRPDTSLRGKTPAPNDGARLREQSFWSFYRNPGLGYEIAYPPDARVIRPTWGTIVGDTPSDLIVKFNFAPGCWERLGDDLESSSLECPGDSIDLAFVEARQVQDLVEEDTRRLSRPTPCATSREQLAGVEAVRVSRCLVGQSSFYYVQDRLGVFKIAVSDPTNPTAQAILGTLKLR